MPPSLLCCFGEPHVVHLYLNFSYQGSQATVQQVQSKGTGQRSTTSAYLRSTSLHVPDVTWRRAEQLSFVLPGWQLAFSSTLVEMMFVEQCNRLLPHTADLERNTYTHTYVCICGVFARCILNVCYTLNIQYKY